MSETLCIEIAAFTVAKRFCGDFTTTVGMAYSIMYIQMLMLRRKW